MRHEPSYGQMPHSIRGPLEGRLLPTLDSDRSTTMVDPSSAADFAFLMPRTAPLGLGELARISVRDAARNARQPVATYETEVQVVEMLPELQLLYVQDSRGTRFSVDQDTTLHTELLPGVTYRALVNAEGYALRISRVPG